MHKNIKIITYTNFPFGGASANFLRYFSLSLIHQKNCVEVLLPTGGYFGNKIDINIKRKGEIEKIKFRHLGFIKHPRNYFGKFIDNTFGLFLPMIHLCIQQYFKKTDIIISYDITFVNTLLQLITKIITKSQFIIILPEYYEKPNNKLFTLALLKWYNFYFGMKYLIKYADKYIVASTYLKKLLKMKIKKDIDVLVLPNLIDPSSFSIKTNKHHQKGKITIGYTGIPTRKDGVIDLIKSFRILNEIYPKTHLLLIGDITNGNSLIPYLKKYAGNLKILKNITFKGLVSYKEIPELLQSCDILTLTRTSGIFAQAGFPTKLGEYFACKKPVVITSVGDIPFYFQNEKHVILVKPEDIYSIVNGFEKLILNKKLSKRLCKNAYIWMNENLNYKNVSRKIDHFIKMEKRCAE